MASAEGPECRVCSEPFDDQNICPRVLSCGHSYCTGCLERLTIEDDKMSCPTCRVEVNLPPAGVAGLPKNFELLSIINTKVTPHHEEGERLYTCEACSVKHPATSFCLNCQEDMCNLARGKIAAKQVVITKLSPWSRRLLPFSVKNINSDSVYSNFPYLKFGIQDFKQNQGEIWD